MDSIKKVIIWGHKLHTHTQSYINYGWSKTFKHLGYDTYWFDDTDIPSVDKFDYNNSLFISEGSAEKNILSLGIDSFFSSLSINKDNSFE